jgi:hypothetical protein
MKHRQKNTIEKVGANSHSTIGFRLEPEIRAILEQRAKLFEQSAGLLARQYTIEALMAEEERQQLTSKVSDLVREVSELRSELSLAVQTLLVSAGKIDASQAEEWVQENFNNV